MAISFREIACFMDPAQPVTSLRELAERHRWLPEGKLPSPVRFRSIAERHSNSTSTRHRFLWYNTALLEGFVINLCDPRCLNWIVDKLGVSGQGLLKEARVSPTQVLEAFGYSPADIKAAFGISDSDLKEAFSGVVDILTWPVSEVVSIGDILSNISVGDMVSKFKITLDDVLGKFPLNPMDVMAKFCEQVLGAIGLRTTFSFGGQEYVDDRTAWISAALAQDTYDLVAMCEVFTPQRQNWLLDEIRARAPNRQVAGYAGPDSSGNTLDSGLFQVTFDRSVLYTEARPFVHRGEELLDSDAWANKGVLLTVVDVGLGALEIFGTHLISGGDIAEGWKWITDKVAPSSAEASAEMIKTHVFETKMAQIDELLQFYKERHTSENVAIVVGDLNLYANKPQEYGNLINKMYANGFKLLDLWPYHRQLKDTAAAEVPDGATSEGEYALFKVCAKATEQRYCDESVQLGGGRIDFIFVENPHPKHTYTLDATRVQRRPFFRIGIPSFLSDHLGLDVTFLVSPRMDQ